MILDMICCRIILQPIWRPTWVAISCAWSEKSRFDHVDSSKSKTILLNLKPEYLAREKLFFSPNRTARPGSVSLEATYHTIIETASYAETKPTKNRKFL